MNRRGDGIYEEVALGKVVSWAGRSHRQTHIDFDKPVNRVVINFRKGGGAWPHPCLSWGLAVINDFRDLNPSFTLVVPHKKGTLILGSSAPGAGPWLEFTDIYGEVAS
jgi:hypothetical protein